MPPNWNGMIQEIPNNVPGWGKIEVSWENGGAPQTWENPQITSTRDDFTWKTNTIIGASPYELVQYSTGWWKKVYNFLDFSWDFTYVNFVSQNPDLTSIEVELKDWKKYQFHQQTPKLMEKLPSPEELLKGLFGLEENQFMEKGELKKNVEIIPTKEQKEKIRQLLESWVIPLVWYIHQNSDVVAYHDYGRSCFFWTSKNDTSIVFSEDGLYITEVFMSPLFLSAVNSKN